jgi:hypothetical protein
LRIRAADGSDPGADLGFSASAAGVAGPIAIPAFVLIVLPALAAIHGRVIVVLLLTRALIFLLFAALFLLGSRSVRRLAHFATHSVYSL